MKIIFAGAKGSGKSSIGKQLAERFEIPFIETDTIIEQLYAEENNETLTFREIFQKIGKDRFRDLERKAVETLEARDWCIVSVGGSTLLDPNSRQLLRKNAMLVYLKAQPDELWKRLVYSGATVYCGKELNEQEFIEKMRTNIEILEPFANILVDTTGMNKDQVFDVVMERIGEEFALLSNAPNTFGQTIRVTTFGESHGKGLGVILDGVPPGLPLTQEEIQLELDRRRPGQSQVFQGNTTGASIGMVIPNSDQNSSQYDNLKDLFRPGHADLTFWKKFGIRDHRGGGRSSGRETASRVAGGAVAKKMLREKGITIKAYALEIAGIRAQHVDYDQIEKNPVRCADAKVAPLMEKAILDAKAKGDSVGGIVQMEIKGVPAGLGDPVFGKLEARLGAAILSIGAVKGVEFGLGFGAPKLHGSQFNDPMKDGKFVSNNAGGILGGISSGADIVLRFAVRPTASISQPQDSINIHGQNINVQIDGRHDPCIVPRIIPVSETMAALLILDLWLIQNNLRPGWDKTE